MNIEQIIKENVVKAIQALYNTTVEADSVQINSTPKNFEGNYSVVVFPYLKMSGKGPEDTGSAIGEYLKAHCNEVVDFNVVKGFCNLNISDVFWRRFLKSLTLDSNYGIGKPNGQTVVVEYSSPNTNKPLHLGHIRNNLLGYSAAEILKAAGYNVKKVQIINDRGIHICKSMLALSLSKTIYTNILTNISENHIRFIRVYQLRTFHNKSIKDFIQSFFIIIIGFQ